MLKLATLLDNPGEPLPETRYRDPARLAELGYNGLVLFGTTSISGVARPDSVGGGEMQRWVQQQIDHVRERIAAAQEAGLEVYMTIDALSLPSALVGRESEQMQCKGRSKSICPASDGALEAATSAVVDQIGQLAGIDGIVLRIGDSDAGRYPYLVGNDVYSPHCARCNRLGRVDRLERVIQAYYDAVVERAGKKLIVRAWNVRPDGMHDSVEMAERMADRLPGKPDDERLVLSFKFTATDFWRYQAWNQSSLVLGDRPVLYELQCQREFEGKGGVPNWQLPLWRDGHPEMGGEAMGLADVAGKVNLAGLWAWVRGGGWGGPFIDNETWIDANVTAVPQLADDPALDPGDVARQWVSDRLGVEDEETAEAICKVLEASPDFVLKGFYVGPFARGRSRQWHPNGDLIQDDLIDASAARRMIAELDDDQLDAVVREKQEAVEAVAARRADLQQRVQKKNQKVLEPMLHTLEYTESLFEALRELLAGLIAHRRWRQSEDPTEGERCRRHLFAAQSHWNHHTQRHATLSGAATAFRESGFWELTQRLTEEVDAEAD